MRQYVYLSTAMDVSRDEVAAIIDVSGRNNPVVSITGFLLFNGRNFLQLIEGPESSLIALMHKLARDPRHSGIVRMVDRELGTRDCPDWSMERLWLAQDPGTRRSQLEAALPVSLDTEIRRMVLNFAVLN